MAKQKKNKFILGITGNIASGKTTVARLFKTANCLLIDADILAAKLLSADSSICQKVKSTFGRRILKANNRIDRKKLAKIVFSDKAALAKLNRIVHPRVIGEITRRIKESGKKVIILDAALIIEAGLEKIVDKLVVVSAKKEQQITRAQKRLGLAKEEIILRMKSQIPQKAKERLADFIIDNSGTRRKTRKQVLEIRRKLWKS